MRIILFVLSTLFTTTIFSQIFSLECGVIKTGSPSFNRDIKYISDRYFQENNEYYREQSELSYTSNMVSSFKPGFYFQTDISWPIAQKLVITLPIGIQYQKFILEEATDVGTRRIISKTKITKSEYDQFNSPISFNGCRYEFRSLDLDPFQKILHSTIGLNVGYKLLSNFKLATGLLVSQPLMSKKDIEIYHRTDRVLSDGTTECVYKSQKAVDNLGSNLTKVALAGSLKINIEIVNGLGITLAYNNYFTSLFKNDFNYSFSSLIESNPTSKPGSMMQVGINYQLNNSHNAKNIQKDK